MKKKFSYLMIAVTMILCTSCGDQPSTVAEEDSNVVSSAVPEVENQQADVVDVDLTQLSSTMVYSEVYNMMVTPDDYIGKKVKMQGQFTVYEDPSTEICYYAVIIADAAACCSQGLEFVLADEGSYPDDYPELGTGITVVGEFETYQEGDSTYCHLIDAKIV